MPWLPVPGIVDCLAAGVAVAQLGRVAASPRVDALVHRRHEDAEVEHDRRYLQAQEGRRGLISLGV